MGSNVQWSSRFMFILASAGFAVGLGNIWRFPYVAGESGGGAFVIIYLGATLLIGVPILAAEVMIGRRARLAPPAAMETLAYSAGASSQWRIVGHMGLAAGLIIGAVYIPVTGWILQYFLYAITGSFEGIDASHAKGVFAALSQERGQMLLLSSLVLSVCAAIVSAGVNRGIERSMKILMPLLLLMLVAIAVVNSYLPGFGEAIKWLFSPDWHRISAETFVVAIGQSFFSIGVALAGMMMYGAYLPRNVSILHSAIAIALLDSAVAMIAGLVVFPAVFSFGLNPASGPGLIFETLPLAFSAMDGGRGIASVFFLLVLIAGVTSIIGFLEALTHWVETRFEISRLGAVLMVTTVMFVMNAISVLSLTTWAEIRIFGKDINGLLDFTASQLLLPLGGFLIAVFAGWVMKGSDLMEEMGLKSAKVFTCWYVLIRYVCPLAVLTVLLSGLFA